LHVFSFLFLIIINIIIIFYCLCGLRGDLGDVVVVIFVGGIRLITWVLLRFLLEVNFLLYRVRPSLVNVEKKNHAEWPA
jgi:hypothetical protein